MHAVIDRSGLGRKTSARSASSQHKPKPVRFSCLSPMQEARINLIREEKFANKIILTPSEERFLFEVLSGLARMADELSSTRDSDDSFSVGPGRTLTEIKDVQDNLVEIITQANRRFVHTLAMQLSEKLNFRVRPEDLVLVGDTGLPIAIRRFDIHRGIKFISYAKWWINKKMYDAIPSLIRDVSTSIRVATTARKVGQYSDFFSAQFQRMPSDDEIADALGISLRCLDEVSKTRIIQSGIPQDILRSRFMGPENLFFLKERREAVRKALKCLTKAELHVISRRFGLGDVEEESLEEVGKNYLFERKVTKENVRQVEARAIGKLRRALFRLETEDGLHSPSGPHNFRFLSG